MATTLPDDRFRVLVQLFFSRFFDKESLSPQGDAAANVNQTLGILAAPGGFISLLLYFNPQIKSGWNLVTLRCLFLAFSMSVISFIVVFEWDAIFPDCRDSQVLFPLPVSLWKLFLAKMTAFVMFLGLFLAAINGIVTFFWPAIFDSGNFLLVIGTHLLAVTAAVLFSALSAAAIQGLLLIVVPARFFRVVATCVQTALLTLMVTLFLLSPLIAGEIRPMTSGYAGLARWIPAYWFSGLYEIMRPAVRSGALLHLGHMALVALGAITAVFALTHIPLYFRHTRKLIETPPASPSGPGRFHLALNAAIDSLLLRNPVQEGVFHYIGQTITRSMKHRLFLAVYAGFGIALVAISVAPLAVVGPGSFVLVVSDNPTRATLMGVPLTLSFILVSGLRAAFSFPAEFTANWAFRMTDTNHTRECLIAMRKWTIVCGVIPLFLLLAPFNLAFFSWQVALFEFFYGVTLSILLVEVMFFDFTKIPFTCGYFPSRNNLVWLIAIYVAGLFLYSTRMANLELRLMAQPQDTAIFFAASALLWLLFWKWHNRAGSQKSLDYLGDDDPIVRTLGLSH
ncbi:MAG TPA: hypothetical protein VHC90_01755 [Bryobacteraceae bacterium]|nr:hypothetical protein [Bryobacteraceae bacterium]